MGIVSELTRPTSMDLVVPPAIYRVLADINPYTILVAVLTLTLITFFGRFKKRQKIVPRIPIVGGSDKKSIQQNRKRFIHDGKAMLLEGYQKVAMHKELHERSCISDGNCSTKTASSTFQVFWGRGLCFQ